MSFYLNSILKFESIENIFFWHIYNKQIRTLYLILISLLCFNAILQKYVFLFVSYQIYKFLNHAFIFLIYLNIFKFIQFLVTI